MLGDAEAVVDGGVAAGGVEAGGGAQVLGIDAGDFRDVLRGVGVVLGEGQPLGEGCGVAARFHEGAVDQPLRRHHMREGVHQRHVGAGPEGEVEVRFDVRGAHQADAARIADDEPGAGAQPALHLRGEDRVAFGGVGADHQNHVGGGHRVEVLGAGGGAEGGLQAVAGGRVADARAGIDVVVAECGAHQLLHRPHFLVGAARGGDAADGGAPVPGLHGLEALGGVVDGLVPADRAPRVRGGFAHHGFDDAVAVVGVAPSEAALDAGMAVVRLAVLVRHHAHHGIALHLGAERAADAAVGAGGVDAAIRNAVLDHGLLDQRRGGAGLHAGAAGDAFGVEEVGAAGGHLGGEAASVDGQRQGALHFVAGAHAAGADDALGRIEGEVGVRGVGGGIEMARPRRIAHRAQADIAGDILQFAIAVGGAGEAIQRVVGDV